MRLIDADLLEKQIEESQNRLETDNDAIWAINKRIHTGLALARRFLIESPTVDTTPLAHWKSSEQGTWCSSCRVESIFEYDYCPHCGAIMDGEQHEID